MHASSLENMQRCYEEYVSRSSLLSKQAIRVLDIGGADVNGSYRDIFSDDLFEYMAVDLAEGPGVDLVIEDPYQLPFAADSFDVVISGQVFEHVEFFWKLFEEMVRVTSPEGFIFLIVPSSGPIHRYPVDCYRFYPDSMRALAGYAGIGLEACWLDDRGPWNDLVGVFTRATLAKSGSPGGRLPANEYTKETAPAPVLEEDINPEEEVVKGEISYLDVIRQIHQQLEPRHYLEIGCRRGDSLSLASCPAVAVDPEPELAFDLPDHQILLRKTSDRFFREDAADVLAERKPDLAFIDGMHLFEFALRDFINIERHALPTSVIIIDDIYPNHMVQAQRKRTSRVWSGDIWKLHTILQETRPDLVLLPIDAGPTGLLLVAGLNPKNRTLTSRYNPLVKAFKETTLEGREPEILGRQGALAPDDPRIEKMLQAIRSERGNPAAGLRARLVRLLQT